MRNEDEDAEFDKISKKFEREKAAQQRAPAGEVYFK
jgi:hypothetical protein